jgi:tetratricopeptide (TPR) repeat protein
MRALFAAFLLLGFAPEATWAWQEPSGAPILGLPSADQLDALGLADVARAAPGTWAGLFVNHQPDPERMASITPQVARLATQAQASFGGADYPRCLAQSREVLRILPDFPPSLLVYASAAFRLRRYSDCLVAMERFAEVAPTEIWRTQVQAHSLYSLGDYSGARVHYLKVIDSAPVPKLISTEARRGLALANYRLGEERRALALLRELVATHPNHGEAWAWLAQVQFDMDELDDALVAAQRAMNLLPFESRPYFLAFRISFELGLDKESEQLEEMWSLLDAYVGEVRTLRNRLLFHPGDPEIFRALAVKHRDVGNLTALAIALEHLLQAEDFQDPTGLGRRIFAIEAFRDLGALDRARAILQRTEVDYPGAVGLPEVPKRSKGE